MKKPTFDIDDNNFILVAPNGKTILVSETYKNKSSLMNGIESVVKNAAILPSYKFLESVDGRYYFVLRAANNKVIGTSQMYKTQLGRWIGVMSVKRNAAKAEHRWIVEEIF